LLFDAPPIGRAHRTPDIPSLANIKKFFDLAEKLDYPKVGLFYLCLLVQPREFRIATRRITESCECRRNPQARRRGQTLLVGQTKTRY